MVSVPRDLKGREGNCSQMLYGGCCNFVGSMNQRGGRVPKLCYHVWGELRRCRSRPSTWTELWRQTLTSSRMPQRATLVRFLYLAEGLGLTFDPLCGIKGLAITRGGGGLLVRPQDLPQDPPQNLARNTSPPPPNPPPAAAAAMTVHNTPSATPQNPQTPDTPKKSGFCGCIIM